ncbi:unnamed protein product [Polarella glacialis]|uniref:Magnesium transporter n=1 Tax=Polarella glacialis TaxID=89957 RepID=A0A813LYU9_POLGL|nr:unnamed protein product [Polarella glacialis]CAE8742639.1 unnamed protein product [Polarella glacialis]
MEPMTTTISASGPPFNSISLTTPAPKGDSLWVLGVSLVMVGTIVGTAGKQLIRYSEQCKQEGKLRKGKILLGLGLFLNIVFNTVCDLSGYAFAPASVIAPLTGMDIVWNTLLAPFTLKEELTPRRLLSAAIIFLTATASVFFRQSQEGFHWTTERVHEVMTHKRFMLYFICFIAWYLLNVCLLMKYPAGSAVKGFSLGATAGTLAGNMWCTKIVAELARQCFAGDCSAWADGISWLVLAGAVFFAVANITYITKGMQQYEALFMVTVFMGSNIATNSLSAIVVLAEMDSAPHWKLGGYTVCILAMIVGMLILVMGEDQTNRNKNEEARVPQFELEMTEEASYGENVVLGAPSSWD